MEELKKRSKTADKSLASTLMAQLTTMKYDGKSTMHDHILEMTSLVAKLKSIGMTVDDSFVIQFIINSLPKEVYGPFHMTYNLNKDVWTLNELTNQLIEESRRLGPYKPHTVNFANDHEAGSSKGNSSSAKGKKKSKNSAIKVGVKGKCHYCHKAGHFKKDCPKRKQWFEKKGMNNTFVIYESHLIDIPKNTWWVDSGSTTHISNNLQGFLSIQTTNLASERFVIMGNKSKVLVEGVGTYRLALKTGYYLDLFECMYIPSFSRNLLSISKMDNCMYTFKFGSGLFSLYKNNCLIGNGSLIDGLYKLDLNDNYMKSINENYNVGMKRAFIDEKSAYLWHKRLGHISKEHIQRLVKCEVLPSLDFTDLNACIDCIKEKQTKHTKKGATRSSSLLEIIHTDICGPFDVPTFNRKKYFITFTDDYSRYGYIYLLNDKSQSLEALKEFITEVERQLDKRVKIIRSDRGGEFYGKYTETGQNPGPFANFLKERGIVAQEKKEKNVFALYRKDIHHPRAKKEERETYPV